MNCPECSSNGIACSREPGHGGDHIWALAPPDRLQPLRDLLTKYEDRVAAGAVTGKIEVHIGIQELQAILLMARAGLRSRG